VVQLPWNSKGTWTAVSAPCSSCADADVCKQHISSQASQVM